MLNLHIVHYFLLLAHTGMNAGQVKGKGGNQIY